MHPDDEAPRLLRSEPEPVQKYALRRRYLCVEARTHIHDYTFLFLDGEKLFACLFHATDSEPELLLVLGHAFYIDASNHSYLDVATIPERYVGIECTHSKLHGLVLFKQDVDLISLPRCIESAMTRSPICFST